MQIPSRPTTQIAAVAQLVERRTCNADVLGSRPSGGTIINLTRKQEVTEFEPFQKIARLKRNCVITEKIDGTNACIYIGEDGEFLTGSRSRWITPTDDNYGFAQWGMSHRDELMQLGPGRHFGEWWGAGIQRRYDQPMKRFSLFNVSRWNSMTPPPACCGTVPVLFEGPFSTGIVEEQIDRLRQHGSVAAPSFMKAEGVIVYLPAARELFKVTVEKDEAPKGIAEAT